jgi:excisionase family DNA binding protein
LERPDRFLSPAQLSRALGLGESTIKRWIDQGRVPAEKTPGGHRRVRLSDALRLLRCGTADAPDARVLGFLPADEASPDTLTAFLCSETPERAIELLESLYASGVATGELSDRWIAPAMQRIGHDWETGQLGVAGEHRATATMLSALHALLRAQPAEPSGAPRAFVAGLSQDPYLLAPLCAQLVLTEAGFATTNFGPDTPPDCLITAMREQRPAIVALSFSVAECTGARARAALGAACRDAGSALVVGGRGLRPDLVDDLDATAWCRSMTELDRMARHLAARSAARDLAQAG